MDYFAVGDGEGFLRGEGGFVGVGRGFGVFGACDLGFFFEVLFVGEDGVAAWGWVDGGIRVVRFAIGDGSGYGDYIVGGLVVVDAMDLEILLHGEVPLWPFASGSVGAED